MSNIWKRSISMFLAMAMVFSMLPLNALADETGDQIVEEAQVVEPVAQTETPEEEPAEEPAEEPTEEPAEEPAEEPTEEPAEEPTEEPTEEVTEAPAEEPTEEATEAPTEAVEETEAATEPVAEETVPVEMGFGEAFSDAMGIGAEEPAEDDELTAAAEAVHVVPDVSGMPSNEELFAVYANNVLYGNGAATVSTAAYDALPDGDVKLAYEALVPVIQAIAAGERGSAVVTLGYSFYNLRLDGVLGDYIAEVPVDFTGTTFGDAEIHQLLNALLEDMPYELYWFDKVSGISASYFNVDGQMQVELAFYVAGNYAPGRRSGGTTVDKSVTGAASAAADTAYDIATSDEVAAMTDYEKLVYFKNYICGQVSYDHDAADYGVFSEDIDPWQIIHVFDGDSSTNVVCEGYSKAYQYLCDMATFDNKSIRCYTVTGKMDGGDHMWNLVAIDGASYMVDVTNSDDCTIEDYINFGEDNDALFLSGNATGSVSNGYTFDHPEMDWQSTFVYDQDTKDMLEMMNVPAMSATAYTPEGGDIDMGGDDSGNDDDEELLETNVHSEAELRSAIDDGYKYIYAYGNITLTDDLVLPHAGDSENPQAQKLILKGDEYGTPCVLTVPAGKTLTLNSRLNIQDGSSLIVNGTLVNNVYEDGNDATDDIGIWCEDGYLIVNGTYQNTNGGLIIVTTNYGFFVGGTNPIPNSGINRNTYVYSEETLLNCLDVADEYAYNQMDIYEPIILSGNITIPENADVVVDGDEGGKLTVPAGKTLTNNGFIDIIGSLVMDGDIAEIVVSGSLINNKQINVKWGCSLTIEQGGTFTNNGIITGAGTYPDSGETEEPVENDLAALQAALNGASGTYELTEDMTLSGELTIPEGVTLVVDAAVTVDGELTVKGSGDLDISLNELIVPAGTTLIIHNPVYVRGGKIIVKDGGFLHIDGRLEITEGAVIAEDGSTVTYGGNAEVIGQITFTDSVPEPYLLGRWLRNDDDGTGWYENFDEALSTEPVQGVRGQDYQDVIFYLNEWDALKQEWVATPVLPTSSDSDLYSVNQLSDEEIREGEANADFFVRMEGYADLHHHDTTITVGEETFGYSVWGRQMSFYTAPEATVENLIRDHKMTLNPDGENVFYAIFNETDWANVYDWSIRIDTWGENYNDFVPEGEVFIDVESLKDSNGDYTGVCKFTVNPAYTEYVQYNWKNFHIEVTAYTESHEGGDYESWGDDLFINPPQQEDKERVWIDLDDTGYIIFEDNAVFTEIFTGEYDSEGNEIWKRIRSELPAGVSFDFDSRTMMLEDAKLRRLVAGAEDLHSDEFTIELKGENEIINEESSAVHLEKGLTATITGDGSLYVKGTNVDAFNLDDGSSLILEGNAELTVEIADGNSHQTALWGSGGNLTVCENATLTTVVPENAVRYGADLTDYGMEANGIFGFNEFYINDAATVNTQFYNVPNDGSFNLLGGTVNIKGLDGVWSDGNNIEYTSEGLYTECGEININGGELNINVAPDPAEGCSTYFHGIATDYGTVNISGGTVNINSTGHRGMGIKIAAKYEENGELSNDVGGFLKVSGGTVNFNRTNADDHPISLYVYAQSSADICGGTFNVAGQSFLLEGYSDWNNAEFNGDGANFVASRFNMESGKIYMENSGHVFFIGEAYLTGGLLDLDNSYMVVDADEYCYGNVTVMGDCVIDMDMDINEVNEEFENGGYEEFVLRINGNLNIMDDAKIDIDINTADDLYAQARLSGIQVNGVYQQMGGEITVNNGNPTCATMASFGQSYLRDGVLNLNGGRTGLVQAFDDGRPEEEWSILQVHGGELNINGNPDGILVEGPTEFYGGCINITAEAAAEEREPSAIAVMTTGENSHSYLAIFGGDINLNAYEIDETEGEDDLDGIALYAYGAPINIYGGTVEMDADIAMWIDGDIYMDGEGITFADAEGKPLTLPADGESHILSYADGTVAKNAVITVTMSLSEFLKNEEPDEDGRYKVGVNLYVDENTTLVKTIVDIMPGGSLTVKNGAVLTIDESSHLVTQGGTITVENGGKIVNNGILANDGGSIHIASESGYEHNGAMNTHYHGTVLNDTQGIPVRYQSLYGDVENLDQVNTMMAMAENYEFVEIWTPYSVELDNMTIPAKVRLAVDGQEETAAVNVTGTLTIDGELAIGNVNMTVAEGAKVIVNRSLITDANDSAKIVVNGTLETGTGAEITLNQATMTVNGTCEIAQESSIFVNDGSAMTVNGTLNNYGWFHVGFYADEAETAGLLFVNGTMNNYNYLNVVKKDVLVNEDDPDEVDYSGGVVNVTATGILNICADENHWGFMEHHGELNIEGQVKVDAGLDICPEGTVTVKSGGSLINNDTVKIYGNMDIYGTVTNNMQFWMEDSEDGMAEPMVTGYEGSEFINNTSVWNRSASGVLDLSNTAYTHGYIEIEGSRENAELCQRYFSDDHLSDVTVNGMENEDIYLVYEGGVESLIRGVYAYGEAKGYKGSTARVVGNVVLNSDLTIGSGDTLVVMRGEYLTLNSGMTLTLTENGMLNLTPGAVLTVNTGAAIDNQGRFITNAGYGEWADSVIYQNGVLTNSGDMTIMGDIRGMCGTGLSWIVENEILTISGSGAMISYENAAGVPWNALKITKVELSEGITSISAYAFANIGSVTVRIPRSVETIGSNAFGAEMALEVYCKSAALTYAKTNSLKYTEIHNMVDDTCADCGYTEKELFEIDFVSMVLQNSLMMRFAFPANSAEDWTGAYAVATKTYADGTANVSQRVEFADWNSANINGAAHYHFAFDEIAGKEMSDEIYVTVYNADGDAISKEYVETVRSYVMRMLAKDTTAASVKAMMVDMLNYGAAAQNTFSYATDDLANSQLSDEQKGYGSADMQACTDIRIKGANYQGSRLLLESSINFQMAFAGLTEEMTANISFTDHYGNVQNYTVNPIKMESSGTVVVSIDQIVVADARRPITVTVYDTNGQVYGTATDSIESYVARMTSGGDPLYEMVIKFADSAYAYMHP